MRLGNWLLLLVIAALLSTAVFPIAARPMFRPDLFAVLVVFVTPRARRDEVLQLCWLTGLLKDIISGGPLGATALLYLVMGLALVKARRIMNLRAAMPQVLSGFALAFATEAVLLAPAALGANRALLFGALKTLLSVSLITGVVTPLVIWFLDRLERWLGLRRRIVFGAG